MPPQLVALEEYFPKMPFPWKRNLKKPVSHVVLGVTITEMCFTSSFCVKEIAYFSKKGPDRRTPNMPFNFFIGGDGSVFEGRGWDAAPELPLEKTKFKNSSIYIGFIGRFWKCPPSRKMLMAKDFLVQYGIDNNFIRENFREHNVVV